MWCLAYSPDIGKFVWPKTGKQHKRLGHCLHLPMKQVLPEILCCVPGSVQGDPTVCVKAKIKKD